MRAGLLDENLTGPARARVEGQGLARLELGRAGSQISSKAAEYGPKTNLVGPEFAFVSSALQHASCSRLCPGVRAYGLRGGKESLVHPLVPK